MKTWISKLDTNDVFYYAGLVMLFVGLSLSVSVATALTVVGAALALVSFVNSLIVVWLSKGTQ